jgi:hypothetical protein
VAEELLAVHYDEFSAALAELEGLCEYIVRDRRSSGGSDGR